jgi:plastocyanin
MGPVVGGEVKAALFVLLATLTAVGALSGGAASAGSGSSGLKSQSSDCPTGTTLVDITGTWEYVPATIDIDAGTTVCWTNQDGWTHTVTSDKGEFDSGVIGLTQIYCFTFTTAGSYPYHDELHSFHGTVNVHAGPPPPPPMFCPPPPAPPPPSCPDGATVVDVLPHFRPIWTYIVGGGPVCWWNRSESTRRVTSDTGDFDSGEMEPNSTYVYTFETPGSYSYHEASTRWPGKVTVDTNPPSPPTVGCRADATRVHVNFPRGFDPKTVEVAPGTTVCWQNQGGWLQTATSDTGVFDSGVIPHAVDNTYSFTFDQVGSFAYHDALNPELTGTVNVTVPRIRTFRVPRVIGLKLPTAKSRIRRSRGSLGRVRRARSRRVGRVIGQRPRPGAIKRRGYPVALVVGRR